MSRLELSETELADLAALKAIAVARRKSSRGKLKRRASDAAVLGLAGAIGGQCVAAAADELDRELIDSLAGLKVVDDLTALDADCDPAEQYSDDDHIEHGAGLFSNLRHNGPEYLSDPFTSRFANHYQPDQACHAQSDGQHNAAASGAGHDAQAVAAHREGHEAAGHGEHEGEGHGEHGDHEVLAANEHDEHDEGEGHDDGDAAHIDSAGHAQTQHAGSEASHGMDGGHHAVMAMAHGAGMTGSDMPGGHDSGLPVEDMPAGMGGMDMDDMPDMDEDSMAGQMDEPKPMSLADMEMPPAEDLAATMPPMV
jgi:hypothetical protein